ncbi:MAG: twin-arginine translocation signal domain-containing protein [Deferribacterota bacterium]|nr:twin-arginine translocation signal domain-containing protein [Deferribacterota bacterium]
MKNKFFDRRGFLKGMTAVLTTMGVAATAKPVMKKDSEIVRESLYRETEHFKKYYKTLRD